MVPSVEGYTLQSPVWKEFKRKYPDAAKALLMPQYARLHEKELGRAMASALWSGFSTGWSVCERIADDDSAIAKEFFRTEAKATVLGKQGRDGRYPDAEFRFTLGQVGAMPVAKRFVLCELMQSALHNLVYNSRDSGNIAMYPEWFSVKRPDEEDDQDGRAAGDAKSIFEADAEVDG